MPRTDHLFKPGNIPFNKGKTLSEETKKKISSSKMGHAVSPQTRLKLSASKKGCKPYFLGKRHTPETREKMRLAKLGRKQTREHIRNSLRRRPMSKLEEKVLRIITKHNLPYKFVGNGAFFIERKNPDFVNTNGKKIAVEVFWREHKEKFRGISMQEWMDERSKVFAEYGWTIVYIENRDINEDYVVNALRGGGQHS